MLYNLIFHSVSFELIRYPQDHKGNHLASGTKSSGVIDPPELELERCNLQPCSNLLGLIIPYSYGYGISVITLIIVRLCG